MTRYRERHLDGVYLAPQPDLSTMTLSQLRAEAKRFGLHPSCSAQQHQAQTQVLKNFQNPTTRRGNRATSPQTLTNRMATRFFKPGSRA